jgi:hypothetical protein
MSAEYSSRWFERAHEQVLVRAEVVVDEPVVDARFLG